jgi:hypothetical protein
VLANQAALALVQDIKVLTEVRDGSHSPVVVSLCLPVVRLSWRRPRPQLPDLLRGSAVELCDSEDWKVLMERWAGCIDVQAVLADTTSLTLEELSGALYDSLQTLVRLAGGWRQSVALPMSRMRSGSFSSVLRCCTGWTMVYGAALWLLAVAHGSWSSSCGICSVLGWYCKRAPSWRCGLQCRQRCRITAINLLAACA